MPTIIDRRCFRLEELQWFALASGDWNPIHIDPLLARRLLTGEVIVHGMFTLLWALDAYCAAGGKALTELRATFSRPVFIGDPLVLVRELAEQDTIRLMIQRGDEIVITVVLTVGDEMPDVVPEFARPMRMSPEVHTFASLKGVTGHLPVMALPEDIRDGFPNASAVLGMLPVAALMGLSRLVGMYCPGLHSLFSGVGLRFEKASALSEMHWQVQRHTVPQAPLRITVNGGGLSGQLDTFVRPAPVMQSSMVDVAVSVTPGSFVGQMGLVVGGSRGLGELTAKLIAAGGGSVIITYANGKADAERVASEINAWGGDCRILAMDVAQPSPAIEVLLASETPPTHLYYFAARHIGRPKSGLFDSELFRSFNQIFVADFFRLVIELKKNFECELSVFYPSSVFLDQLPREHSEYIAAKAAGEAVCRHMNQHVPGLRVLVRRLPRMLTDQTVGLLQRAVDAPLPVLLQVVKDLCFGKITKNIF